MGRLTAYKKRSRKQIPFRFWKKPEDVVKPSKLELLQDDKLKRAWLKSHEVTKLPPGWSHNQ